VDLVVRGAALEVRGEPYAVGVVVIDEEN